MKRLLAFLLSVAASVAFGAERQIINPDTDGDLIFRLHPGGTKTAVGNIEGTNGAWTIGASASTVTHALNGKLSLPFAADGTGSGQLGFGTVANALLTSGQGFFIILDSDNDQTDREFRVSHNSTGSAGATDLFKIVEPGTITLGPTAGGVSHRVYGNLGFGTASAQDFLHIKDTESVISTTQIRLESAQGGYGAGIEMGAPLNTSGAYKAMAKVTADGENSWDSANAATQDAGLRFFTTLDGTTTERARFTSTGELRTNETITAFTGEVRGSTNAALMSVVQSAGRFVRSGKNVTLAMNPVTSGASTATGAVCLLFNGAPDVDASLTQACTLVTDSVVWPGTGPIYCTMAQNFAGNGHPYCCAGQMTNGGASVSILTTSQSGTDTYYVQCNYITTEGI